MEEKDYRKFFNMLKEKSAAQYLRATAFSRDNGVDFDGAVSEPMFFEEFYVDTQNAIKLKKNVLKNVNDTALRLNLLIGYSGCGKTTFVHYLLREKKETRYIFDMEIGIDNRMEDPILTKICNELENTIMEDIINGGNVFQLLHKVFFAEDYKVTQQVNRLIDLNEKLNPPAMLGRIE